MTREETASFIRAYLDGDTAIGNIIPIRDVLESAITYLMEQPSLPAGLEEASHTSSEEFVYNSATPFPNSEYIAHRIGFKAGAEWHAEQGETYTTEVIMLPGGIKKIQHAVEGFEPGDKVIVQIRKK